MTTIQSISKINNRRDKSEEDNDARKSKAFNSAFGMPEMKLKKFEKL